MREKRREIANADAYVSSACARKKVGMLFAHLNEFYGSTAYAGGGETVRGTNSCWRPPPKTSENSRNWFLNATNRRD